MWILIRIFWLCLLTGHALGDKHLADVVDAIVEEDNEGEESIQVHVPPFVPTREWQVVENGQSIPAGLHVRMNLETGLKEAKLLDPKESKGAEHLLSIHRSDEQRVTLDSPVTTPTTASSDSNSKTFKPTGDKRRLHHYGNSDRRGIINKKTKPFTRQELMEAIQIQEKREERPIPGITFTAPVREGGREGDASSSPVLSSLNIKPTDKEVMVELLRVLEDTSGPPQGVLQALEEMEYLVHQVDNARELDGVGGTVVLLRLLNSSNEDMRGLAAQVIGAAVQSNPPVQASVLSYGGLTLMWALVSSGREPEAVQKRALFGIGSLLRRNSWAQDVFMEQLNGYAVLAQKFWGSAPQFQLRAVVLVTDLVLEEQERAEVGGASQSLLSGLSALGWCDLVSSLIYWDNIQGIEKGLQAMVTLDLVCDFDKHHNWLQTLKSRFEAEREEGGGGGIGFASDIVHNCERLLETIPLTGEGGTKPREEL